MLCRGLRTLFNTLLSSLPAVFNVGSLLFLMFFIYAILGMNLFGTQDNELSQQDPHANFLSFGSSMLTLFRLSTSDSWDQILQVCFEWNKPCSHVTQAALMCRHRVVRCVPLQDGNTEHGDGSKAWHGMA